MLEDNNKLKLMVVELQLVMRLKELRQMVILVLGSEQEKKVKELEQ